MANTWSQVYLHIVFGTKLRRELLSENIQERVHKYMGGTVRGMKCSLLEIGGMPDHVHMLVKMRLDVLVPVLMREVKARSSRWVHESFPDRRSFGWQDGYAVFSVSASQVERVSRYIRSQARHHRRRSFKEELLELLRAHGVEFDERYVFE